MIDIHCLLPPKQDDRFFPLLSAQMTKEKNVNFFVLQNGTNIGAGRTLGFLKGNAPYVSYVDYDDLIIPGVFGKIEGVLNQGADWCYTDEYLIDENGKGLQPGWSSHPELYSREILQFVEAGKGRYVNHIVAFRRKLLTKRLLYVLMQLSEHPETWLRSELGRNENCFHIQEVGYLWRQHADNGYKRFAAYKAALERRGQV